MKPLVWPLEAACAQTDRKESLQKEWLMRCFNIHRRIGRSRCKEWLMHCFNIQTDSKESLQGVTCALFQHTQTPMCKLCTPGLWCAYHANPAWFCLPWLM